MKKTLGNGLWPILWQKYESQLWLPIWEKISAQAWIYWCFYDRGCEQGPHEKHLSVVIFISGWDQSPNLQRKPKNQIQGEIAQGEGEECCEEIMLIPCKSQEVPKPVINLMCCKCSMTNMGIRSPSNPSWKFQTVLHQTYHPISFHF